MEVMLIQMPVSISGVLRGDGLKWKPLQQLIKYANFMPLCDCWIFRDFHSFPPAGMSHWRFRLPEWQVLPIKKGERLLPCYDYGFQTFQTFPTRSGPGFRVGFPGVQPDGVASVPLLFRTSWKA